MGKRRPENGQQEAFAQIADEIAEETRFYETLYERKGIKPTEFALAMARAKQRLTIRLFKDVNPDVKGDPGSPDDPARARTLWEKYYNEARNLGAAIDELPTKTDCPFYDLIKLGQLCKDRAQKQAKTEQPTDKGQEKAARKERKSNPVKDRFTFSPGQVRFDNKDLHLPTGFTIDVLRKLVDNFGRTVGHRELDENSEAKNASEQLRDAKRKITKALKAKKAPCKIETKKGEGYLISPQTTHK